MTKWSMFKGNDDYVYELETKEKGLDYYEEMVMFRSQANMREAKIEYIIEQLKEMKQGQNIDVLRMAIHNLLMEIT